MNWFKNLRKRLKEPMPSGNASSGNLNNLTPRAQQVLALARVNADRLNHNFVGTEHLLLGLIALGQGLAVNVLQKLGLNLQCVRAEVEKEVGLGPNPKIIGNIPYTPRVKKVLALAAKEASALSHTYVGTEHILLGLLREGDGVAARLLKNLNVNLEQTRQQILKELKPDFGVGEPKNRIFSPKQADSGPMRVELSRHSASTIPSTDLVDLRKRYDVYCEERGLGIVVYRNAFFKGNKKLSQCDSSTEFVELEQANGQTIFLSKSSIVKFCEYGNAPTSETASGKEI